MKLTSLMRTTVTSGLLFTVFMVYSMAAFAMDKTPVGDIAITGPSVVLVDGQRAVNGQAIFNGSTIATADAEATLILGKSGKLTLESNSSFTLSIERDTISGSLNAGSMTLLVADQPATVHTLKGDVKLNVGDSTSATSNVAARDHRDANGNCVDDDKDGKLECHERVPGWVWFAIAGGVAAAIIIGVTAGGDDNVIVSPLK